MNAKEKRCMAKRGDLEVVQTPEAVEEINLNDLCAICHVTPDFIIELISYGTIEPQGKSASKWRFDAHQLHVIRTAVRLHHDLEINHAGIALAIDLLDQVEDLQTELRILKKYFKTQI
jgi:chaperone modulatory protein CbpM